MANLKLNKMNECTACHHSKVCKFKEERYKINSDLSDFISDHPTEEETPITIACGCNKFIETPKLTRGGF